MKHKKCLAIILQSKTFFESDKRLECFSPELGKFTCLAKSGAKKTSKKGHGFHPLSVVELDLYQGKSFLLVTHCDIVTHFRAIQSSFNHMQYALLFCSIILKSCHDMQANTELFKLFYHTLKALNNHKNIKDIALSFYTHFLKLEGVSQNLYNADEKSLLNDISNYVGYIFKKPLQLDDPIPNLVK